MIGPGCLHKERRNVAGLIVAKERCCGCGVCAAICPSECIIIEFNSYKELTAKVDNGRCAGCGRCIAVCPDTQLPTGDEAMAGESAARTLPYVGSVFAAYTGYAAAREARWRGSSGGLVAQILEELLRLGEIDAGVVARSSDYQRTGRFFEAGFAATPEEIRASCGSKYYPIEFSKVLKEISRRPRRYALVALPCVAAAVRKAQSLDSGLRDGIRFILVLACGHNVSAAYTEYLLGQAGIDPRAVSRLGYRNKEGTRSADDYNLYLEYLDQSGRTHTKRLGFHSSIVGRTWSNYMFALPKCLLCSDFAGECADASFADAWLPEYMADVRGTSFVLARREGFDRLLRQMARDSRIVLSPIEPDKFLQAHQRRFRQKRDLLRPRLRWLRLFDKAAPAYGFDYARVGLWHGAAENLALWLGVHGSRRLHRRGLLARLGTDRYLRIIRLSTAALAKLLALFRIRGS